MTSAAAEGSVVLRGEGGGAGACVGGFPEGSALAGCLLLSSLKEDLVTSAGG